MTAKVRSLRLYFAIAIVLTVLSFTPLRIISLVSCIVLWAIYWPLPRVMNSWLLRLVMGFVLTTCFQQLTAAVFWLIKVHYTVPIVVILELLVYLALVYFSGRRLSDVKIKLISRSDIAPLIVSVGSTAILLVFMLHGGNLLQQLLRQVTTGYDNIEHISLTQTIYNNQGYLYGPVDKVLDKVVYSNLGSYPQGWSLTASIWWHGFSSQAHIQTHPTKVLLLYVSVFLLWFTLIVFLFCRLLLSLVEFIRKKPNDATIYFGSIAFTALAEVVFLISVVYNGFASFLPSLLLPLALSYLLVGLLDTADRKASPNSFLVSGLLISGGISFSWLLTAPVGYIMVILGLIAYFNGSVLAFIRWLFSDVWRVISAALLVGLASIQGFVQILYGVKNLVNMPGGINDINSLIAFTFLIIALAAMLYFKGAAIKNVFATILSGSLIISGGIYLYQFISSGSATYFSTKAGYVALLLIFLLAAASLLAVISDFVTNKTGHAVGIVFVAAFVIFLPIATNLNLGTSPQLGIGSLNYLFGRRFLSETSASQVSDLLANHKLNQGSFAMDKHLGFAEDVITTHFADMVSRNPSLPCQELQGTLSSQWNIRKSDVLACAKGKQSYVIGSSSNYQSLVKEFKDSPTVKVILSN